MTTYLNNTARPTPPEHADVALRLLPWTNEAGTPCYLSSTDNNSYLSRLADEVETAQTNAAREVLSAAKAVLNDKKAGPRETRFALARATESLGDILRIAQSRAERLPALEDAPNARSAPALDNEHDEETVPPAGDLGPTEHRHPNEAPTEYPPQA